MDLVILCVRAAICVVKDTREKDMCLWEGMAVLLLAPIDPTLRHAVSRDLAISNSRSDSILFSSAHL